MSRQIRLQLENVVKEYPGCRANDGISLLLKAGEIHALLGENGAGKSTLMKVIYGLVQPDEGRIIWNGNPVKIVDPAYARQLGIGMVFQHFSLFETLTVAENIALSLPAKEARSRAQLELRIRDASERYGMALNPCRYVNTLSVGERQRVEIIRCLIQGSKLLILDEPTSVLTPQEVATLFKTLRQLANEGCSVLFISHKLQEVRSLCHRATVLRQGKVTGQCVPAEVTAEEIARLMVGGDTPLSADVSPAKPGSLLLKINSLDYATHDPFGTSLHGVTMDLCAGEIVGIAGVAGNGQDELLRALSGEIILEPQHLLFDGCAIGGASPRQRRRMGMAVVPEERLGRGAVPNMSLVENTLLTFYGGSAVRCGRVFYRQVKQVTSAICSRFSVRTAGVDSTAASLSGGNLQKFIIGRESLQASKILIASHPTWGVDVGSAVTIHETLVALRDRGAAVLLISEDLDELFQLCNRIGAICDGRLSPLVPTNALTIEQLGQWMAGEFVTLEGIGLPETNHAVA